MAMFPITGRFVGDFLPVLVAVDTDDTMDQVAEKVAAHSVGHRLPAPVEPLGYDVLLNGQLMPAAATLAAVVASHGVRPLQWFDVQFRELATSDV